MAEGEGSRRNTVYDLTSLRLHPDGSRVQQTETKNLALGKRRDVVYHPRRGWFAGDAGGKVVTSGAAVLKRKRAVSCGDDDDGGSGGDASGSDGGDSTVDECNVTVEEESRGRTMERKPRKPKSARARKRQRFLEDESFIGKLTQKLQEPGHKDNAPSADLLKGIHHLSSKFYQSRGALEQVHKHKLEKKRQKGKDKQKAPETPEPSQHHRCANAQPPTQSEDEAKNEAEQDKLKKYLDSPESPTPSTSRNNAYRVFEGSLLLGLGVLTQEKIARMLEFKTPQRDGRKDVVGDVGAYPTPYPSSQTRYSDLDNLFLDQGVGPIGSLFRSEESQAGDLGHARTVSIEGWEAVVFEDALDGYKENSMDPDEHEANSEMEGGTSGGRVAEGESAEASDFMFDEEVDELGSESE